MDGKLQRRIQRYGWDRAADDYEPAWKNQLEPAQTRMLELAAINAGDSVLDIACGTGLVTFRAAELTGPQGRVIGQDISQEMVERALRRSIELGFKQVSFERAEAERPGVEEESFDVVIDGLGLMYVPDPVRAVGEMWRALKTNGRAAAAVWGRRECCGWAEIFPIVDSRVQSDVCPLFFRLGSGTILEHTFRNAGFEDITTDRLQTELHYKSADDALAAAFAGGPVALAYSRFDESTREQAHDEYLRSIDKFQKPNGQYAIPGEFVIVAGKKT